MCDSASSLAWYVLKTKPRSERLVSDGLARHKIMTYVPLVPLGRGGRRRSNSDKRPGELLFPGYVFVKLDVTSSEWIRTRSYPGVSYVLSFDGRPAPLPTTVIEVLEERVQRSWTQSRLGVSPFQPGDRVRIVDGPFGGLDAIFDRPLSGPERCQVLLNLVSHVVTVTISNTALEASTA